jgi:hypothetical protein
MAGFCLTAGELSVARALLDQIHAAVQEHALDGWAPALVLDACTRRMECYDQLAEGAAPEEATSLRDVADAAFERICELDPSRAAVLRDQRPSQE